MKAPRHWPLCGEFTGFPAQMTNNAENVSIWWRHHVIVATLCYCYHKMSGCYITLLLFCYCAIIMRTTCMGWSQNEYYVIYIYRIRFTSLDDMSRSVALCSNSSALAMELLQSCTKPWNSLKSVSYYWPSWGRKPQLAYVTHAVNPSVAKPPLDFNGCLGKRGIDFMR